MFALIILILTFLYRRRIMIIIIIIATKLVFIPIIISISYLVTRYGMRLPNNWDK